MTLHRVGALPTPAFKKNKTKNSWLFEFAASKVRKVHHSLAWPPKLCIFLDRQNISPLCSFSLYPNKGIQMWMWSRGTTSVFPVDICKTLYLLSILEGSCFLLSFPPIWFSQLEGVWGLGEPQKPRRTAENLCLTPSWAPTTQPIQAWGITIAPLGCW